MEDDIFLVFLEMQRDGKRHPTFFEEQKIKLAKREIQLIAEVLTMWATCLDERAELYKQNPPEQLPKYMIWQAEYKAGLCRDVAKKLADGIGLDMTYPKCQKLHNIPPSKAESDVAEDALVLAAKRGFAEKQEQKKGGKQK